MGPGADREPKFEIVNAARQKTVGREHVPAKGARGRRYPAGCRTDRDHITETRRRAHGAAEIGAVCERGHSCCDGDSGTARGAAGRQRGIERIARRSAQPIGAHRAKTEFRRVGLANDNSACRPKPRHHQLVLIRHVVLEQQRSIRRVQTPRVGEILYGNRNAMQRSYRTACRVACVGLTACTVGIDGHESRKAGVVRGNTCEMSLEHSTCGNLTLCQSLGKPGCRPFAEIGIDRHGARMHELSGNDDSAGTGFAYPLSLGGVLHG